MNPKKTLKSRLFSTPVFKGLMSQVAKENNVKIVKSRSVSSHVKKIKKEAEIQLQEAKREVEKVKETVRLETLSTVSELVEKGVKEELFKEKAIQQKEAYHYRYPDRINSNSNPDAKPGADVPFSYMRRMAQIYPIARACINRRVRQITQLNWDVTTVDKIEDEAGYEEQIEQAKTFLKEPMGHRTRMRELLTMVVEDLLTIDAICFEIQQTRGGGFLKLIPVDPTTIALRVTETGGTPEPPEEAYVQIIRGQRIAGFTTDEMIYDFMGNSTQTPYGRAPLESLILQTEAALRGTLYNLNYFRENNVPEGFIALPEDIAQTKELVEEWQMWFDAMVAGDHRFTHRLKILPGGTTYTAAKKPEDMAFERFELWLLQQTCMVFDVQPQDIGVTMNVNKATAGSQQDIGRERGLIPLGNFIKEIMDDIIQNRMGFTELQFMWSDINPVDRKEEVELAEKEINIGALSVDEYRLEHGREPIGLDQYVKTGSGAMLVKDIVSGKAMEIQQGAVNKEGQKQPEKKKEPKEEAAKLELPEDPEELSRLQLEDIKLWKKCVLADLKAAKPLRMDFETQVIDSGTYKAIQKGLLDVHSKDQAKTFFDQFIDAEVRASLTLVDYANKLRESEHESHKSD